MAKNLTLGRILALMPHCCKENRNSTTTVEHTLDLNQDNILDLSEDNTQQIAELYINSWTEEDYNKFLEDPLDSNFEYEPINLINFIAESDQQQQTVFEFTLDPTTYALSIEFGIHNFNSYQYYYYDTHHPNLTANDHQNYYSHPIPLKDLISENGVKVYEISFSDSNPEDIFLAELEDFRLYCQYNSETNELILSVVPTREQNNLVSTVTVNGITAQDEIEFPSGNSTTNIIVGYSEAVGSNEYFNELVQNDVDNLNSTEGIAILLQIPEIFSGRGPQLLSINDSTLIEANIENEEVINDLR